MCVRRRLSFRQGWNLDHPHQVHLQRCWPSLRDRPNVSQEYRCRCCTSLVHLTYGVDLPPLVPHHYTGVHHSGVHGSRGPDCSGDFLFCDGRLLHIDSGPHRPDPIDQQAPFPQVTLYQLHVVHHVLHGWDLPDPSMLVTTGNAAIMADGQRHTHRTCFEGPERLKWMKSEYAQLRDVRHCYQAPGRAS
jgi:hypothetical protein